MSNELLLKESAEVLGFESNFVADVLEKLGPAVLETLVEAVRNGFSVSVVIDLLKKIGPTLFEILVTATSKLRLAGAPAGDKIVAGELLVATEVEELNGEIFKGLLEKFLPIIIEKYGDKLLKLILDMLMKAIV